MTEDRKAPTPPGDAIPYARIKEVFEEVLKKPLDDRDQALSDLCGDDAALAERVQALLDRHAESGDLLDQDILAGVTISQALASDDPAVWEEFLKHVSSHRSTWERYRDQGAFARGGMGEIHKVHDADLRRTLAMKLMLTREDTSDPSRTDVSLGRFLEEAQVTSQLDHPGIVPVHEIGVDEQSRVYFTMKLVKGEDLRAVFDRVRDPRDDGWNTTRALSTLLKVCEAMAYAHAKGVIHRDLKPANVMVGKYGESYVMDWGLARVMGQEDRKDLRIAPAASSSLVRSERKDSAREAPDSPLITMDGDVVGTPAYMPPEQAEGRIEEMGPHSDVYAVGAMLYELLTGQMPYVKPGARISPRTILANVQQGPPTPVHSLNREVAAELVAVFEKAMARGIPDRYADMTELAVDLRAYLENRVVAAYESGAIAELRKWVKRNKALATTAAAAVLAVLVLSGWALVERQTARANEMTALAQKNRAAENATLAEQRAREAEAERKKAEAERQKAEAERQKAEAEKQRVLRLSDIKTLTDLKAEMDGLWPAHPDKVEAMQSWLERAEILMRNLPDHERTLTDLRARGTARSHPKEGDLTDLNQQAEELTAKLQAAEDEEERAKLENDLAALQNRIEVHTATIERERPHTFKDARDVWWHATLVDLVSGLVAFSGEDPYGATIANIRKRLEFAESIEKDSITYYRAEWDEAIVSIADRTECPEYNGLELTPQLGLVPIGRDSDSGLWEFWHVQTGERPERDEEGKLVLTDKTGLVFVLIPGGTFWMGAQASDPDGQNYDPQAEDEESDDGRPVTVTLDPYFLSKYEMTQGQWQRFTGLNPSGYSEGDVLSGQRITLQNPVEQVSWEDCVDILGRLELMLPTEAQWEYGCRAGTETPWWPGAATLDLQGSANLADQFLKSNGGPASWQYEPDLNDGLGAHAPVGRLRANGFGLHDVHGNVWEWCLDGYGSYENAARPGDGLREVPGASNRVSRGGSFYTLAVRARSAHRNVYSPGYRLNHLGARPAIRVDP